MLKLCLAILLTLPVVGAFAAEIDFDLSKETPGKCPPGFQSLATGQGSPADWKVVDEKVPPIMAPLSPNAQANFAMRPVLAVRSQNPSTDHCALLLYTNEMFTDFSFTTRFKIVGGIVEPMAGIVYRAQDQNNYYVVRASAEGNLLWYRVVGGKQYDMLGIGVKIPIPQDAWEELRVDCSGSGTRCFLNGHLAIPPAKAGAPTNNLAINDTTFSNGKIGFWTRADSECYFVDAHVNYTPKVPFVQVVVESILRRFPAIESLKIYANRSGGLPVIIGDGDKGELGQPGTKVEADVIARGSIYYLKIHKSVEVTLPLRDRNGEIVAALKVRMKSFPGETQATAVSKATVVKQTAEARVDALQGITE
ncbi:MAG TPA: family 16 glycoside hydrolase [Verrucomicrobiae bacterium]|jgi:hypothetical protein|nr:family 16 glycoside hydrolase [Verrucomicrobiae bacterium]